MQSYFHDMVTATMAQRRGLEVISLYLSAEDSDFCRLNRNRVRQAGSVRQAALKIHLIEGGRHLQGSTMLSGKQDVDKGRISTLLATLRPRLAEVPSDPHLHYANHVQPSLNVRRNELADAREVIEAVTATAEGLDLVGIYTAGGLFRGFANSLGQHNWFESYSFNFDWSLYHCDDKAVKCSYAGFNWDQSAFALKISEAREQLAVLAKPAQTVAPGRYRVFLGPRAMNELMSLLSWNGFGLRAHRSKSTPLLKMTEAQAHLSPLVDIAENIGGGLAPNFDGYGFLRPVRTQLIQGGVPFGHVVSARSAKEYGVEPTGAEADETPQSLEMQPGTLATSQVLNALDNGLYINDLWYMNYSDLSACRMTGMTRFACFWVVGGRITAPAKASRFDDTIYRMLGSNLINLTREREFMPSSSTYKERSTTSLHLPGALVEDVQFTL